MASEGAIERWLKRTFRYRDIYKDASHYMRRFYLFRTKPFAVFLHKILRGDMDRHLHCHPWPWGVLILWGSYTEEVPLIPTQNVGGARLIRRGPLSLRFMRAEQRHRLHLDKPVWTLFFRLREWRKWGFWTETGFVPWDEYLGAGHDGQDETPGASGDSV